MHITRTMPKMPVRSGSRPRRSALLVDKSAPPLARIRLAAHRDRDVTAGRPVDLDRHRAEVDVEVGTVGAKRGQPQVILTELLNVVVHLGQPIVDLGGDRSGGFEYTLQRSA